MIKEKSKHFPHYAPLIGIFIVGALAFYLFSYDRQFQLAVSVAMGVAYFVWGLIHHALHKDLCTEVVFEYFFISILGIIALVSLIIRS